MYMYILYIRNNIYDNKRERGKGREKQRDTKRQKQR